VFNAFRSGSIIHSTITITIIIIIIIIVHTLNPRHEYVTMTSSPTVTT